MGEVMMDDYIKADGRIEINKGELFPLGQGLINELKALANLIHEARQNPRKEKAMFLQASKAYSYYYKNVLMLNPQSDKVTEEIRAAQDIGGEEGIKKLENLIFGFDGFKNKLHQRVRKALAGGKFNFELRDMEALFGDIELADHELGSF